VLCPRCGNKPNRQENERLRDGEGEKTLEEMGEVCSKRRKTVETMASALIRTQRNAFVTSSSSGIGFKPVITLVKHGVHVFAPCRSIENFRDLEK